MAFFIFLKAFLWCLSGRYMWKTNAIYSEGVVDRLWVWSSFCGIFSLQSSGKATKWRHFILSGHAVCVVVVVVTAISHSYTIILIAVRFHFFPFLQAGRQVNEVRPCAIRTLWRHNIYTYIGIYMYVCMNVCTR